MVLWAGIILHALLHWVQASHSCSREGLPRQSGPDHLLVGYSRVIMAIWYLVIRPSRAMVVIVPWRRMGR